MSRNNFYFLLFCLLPLLLFFFKPIPVGDLSIWVKLGIDSIDTSSIITWDLYTVSETVEMVYPIFLSIVYGVLFKLGELETVSLVHAFVPAVWVYIWYLFIRKHSRSYRNAANYWDIHTIPVFIVALLGLTIIYLPRPALVSTIPFLLSYYLISTLKAGFFKTKDILFFVLIEILWVNVHGSFLILPLMLLWQLLFFLNNRKLLINRLISIGAVLLATLFNPFTWKVIPYTWETAVVSKQRRLNEWFPPHTFDYPFASWYFFIASVVLILILIMVLRRTRKFAEIFVDPFFLLWLSGFMAVRNTFFIFLILPIFIFNVLITTGSVSSFSVRPYSKYINFAIIGLIAIAAFLLNPLMKSRIAEFLPPYSQFTYNRNHRVEKINAYLQTHTGLIFNSWEYGSDLALSQKNKYFIDTRNIIFTDRVDKEYDAFVKQPETVPDFLSKYNFRFFVIHQRRTHLLEWLNARSDFKLVMEEGPAFLYEKTDD